MPDKSIILAWDISESRVSCFGVNILVVPPRQVPGDVDAIVEEQDTALVLGAPGFVDSSDSKPAWFLANKLESQTLYEPGSVLQRGQHPQRLLAIVHDLDRDPSCKSEWLAKALDNIFQITLKNKFHSLRLPLLGCQHGKLGLEKFTSLLLASLEKTPGAVEKIWLVTPVESCSTVLYFMKNFQLNNDK